MRILPIVKFYSRRHWLTIAIYLAGLVAITLITLAVMMTHSSTVVNIHDGAIEVYETRTSMNVYRNPSTVVAGFDFSWVIVVLALLLIKKNRELLTTLSVTRFEQTISGFVYIVCASLIFAVLGQFILPVLVYGIMALCGINIQGGWSASMILTGGNPNILKGMYDTFIFMIAMGSVYTLLGYIMIRWWKIILIATAALVITAIIMFTQYSTSKFIVYIVEHAQEIADYFQRVIIPFINRVLDNSNTALYTLRYLGFSVLCTALTYPIMRRMPVR